MRVTFAVLASLVLQFASTSVEATAISYSDKRSLFKFPSPWHVPTNQRGSPWKPTPWWLPFPVPRKGPSTCVVKSHHNANISDVPYIHDAFKQCGKGGIIEFSEGVTYAINELCIITGCNNCEVKLDGRLQLSANTTYWSANAQPFAFQASHLSIIINEAKNLFLHSPSGKGTIDGNGNAWWPQVPLSTTRPILLTTANSTNVHIEGIHISNPPMWNNLITDSSYVTFLNVNVTAISANSSIVPANSDGFDTYRSDHILIQNLYCDNGDDCVSFKPNTTNIVVQNAVCKGSHGISVGSLAQYPGIYDIVANVMVSNVTFEDGHDGLTQNGVRIKSWPGGYGAGEVANITYENVSVNDTNYPITIDSCYENTVDYCNTHPAQVNITNVHVSNVHGVSSGKEKAIVVDLQCTPNALCYIYLANISLVPPPGFGAPQIICEYLSDLADVGVNCTTVVS